MASESSVLPIAENRIVKKRCPPLEIVLAIGVLVRSLNALDAGL